MSKRVCTLLMMGAIILLAVGTVWAQDGPAASAPTAQYERHEFTGYGCALDLPAGGELKLPDSPGWSAEPQVAGEWYGPAGVPVALIQLRVDTMDEPLNAEAFATFCGTLLGNWNDDPAKYTVITANEELTEGQFTWNLIEVEDKSGTDGFSVYYSVFSTYAGSKIYTVSMYYLQPIDDSVSAFGAPVLKSFKLLK
jgi:hypothetical protein